MKKYLLTFLTLGLLLCEASFTGGGVAFAATSYTLSADNKTLTITGSGAMTDWTSGNYTNATTGRGWQSNIGTITKIVISEGVSSVGAYAFRGMTEVTTVEVASTVTSIGSYAFYGCSKLATVKFGTSSTYKCNIDTIQNYAFSSCTAVANVYCYGSSYADAMARWLHIGFNAYTSNPFNASTVTTKYFYTNSSRQTTLTTSNLSGATAIKQFAFYNNTSLTAITLPTTLTWIGKQAFGKCSNSSFTKITIPENVTICGDDVFTGCSALTSVVWNATNCTQYQPGSLYTTSYNPFYNSTVSAHITSFTFGDNVEVVPPAICAKMTNLPTIVIPASVTSIGAETFKGCTSLASIVSLATTPPTVANVNAFTNVTKSIPVVVTSADAVTAYEGATGWSDFTNISTVLSGSCGTSATFELDFATGTLTISGTGAMTDYSTSDSNRSPWYKYNSYITDIVVGSGITAIGNGAFANCDVETCTIAASVTNLVTQCFFSAKVNKLYYGGTLSQWCSITRGTNNTNPVTQKFYVNNSEITSLTLPSITSLAAKTFINMKGITAVTIPSAVTTIGADAFSGCTNIANVYYQGDLAHWCAISFSNNEKANPAYNGASLHITDSDISDGAVFVKDAITSIENYAFCGVNNYESIEINAATTIGTYTFKNCTAQILYRGSASGTSGNVSWTWNNGVLTLTGTGTMTNYSSTSAPWYQYMGSTTSISVGEGITTIGNYAFAGTAATPITISLPSTLTTIGNSAFSGLKDLREVTIPSAVTSIGTGAFQSCINLEKIYCLPATAPSLVNAAGGGTTIYTSFATNAPLYVAPASYSSYSGSSMAGFGANFFIYGDCGDSGDNLQWVYSTKTNTLTISGTGAMENYSGASYMPWNDFKTSITSVVIEDGVTTIGNYAFYGCTALASVTFPETFSSIGNYAFYNCSAITSIALPEGITATGNNVFYGCTSLASVSLPSTLTTIGSNVFMNNALTSITIPNSVTSIGSGAFKGNGSLESVDLGEASLLTTIGNSAFENCSSLTSITIPNKMTSIGNSTFSGCSALAAVNYGDAPTLATIGYSAFKNCSSLTSITIPESVTTITGNNGTTPYTPFSGCENLTTVIWNARNCSGWTPIHYMSSTYYQMPFEAIKTQITSFEFGSNVQSIPQYLCHGMSNLTTVTIHASVTSIGANAFEGCSKIELVTCDATTPPVAQSTTFSDITSNATLVVPGPSKATYASTDYWEDFYRILPYVVQFNLNGHGSAIIADEYVGYGARIEAAPTAPTETGYDFGGWYKEAGCSTPFIFGNELGTVVNSDMTLYAKWTAKEYTISYMDKGDATYSGSNIGSLPATHTYDAETALVDGVKIGYTFGGWFENSDCTGDAITSLGATDYTDAITLYAQWTINQYTISFNSNGGSEVSSITQDYNSAVTAPADPTREGYTFAGWSPAVPSTMPAENTECVAQWTENVFSFADTDTDNSKIVAANGKLALSVTIGRTVWKDGYYNSMCLPFSLTSEQLAASPLAGYKALKRLSEATITGEDENRELNIQLEPITEITAGEPFFISYEVGENITNPVFENVTVTASAPGIISEGDVTCRGLYASTDLGTATTNLFLGANNTLYWPASGQSMIKGLRAYFAINPDSPAKAGMRVRLSDRPAEVPTALEETNHDPQIPIHKYIRDGVLFIERDGKTYNAQGVLVQ